MKQDAFTTKVSQALNSTPTISLGLITWTVKGIKVSTRRIKCHRALKLEGTGTELIKVLKKVLLQVLRESNNGQKEQQVTFHIGRQHFSFVVDTSHILSQLDEIGKKVEHRLI
jgi:hypothetical protein